MLLPPAQAAPPARVLPSHDVQVAYRVSGDAAAAIPGLDGAGVVHLAWDAAGRRLRIQADGRPEIAIVDFSTRQANVLYSGLRATLVLLMRASDVSALTLTRARFKRQGSGSVLGYACTEWKVRSAHGTGTMCVTPDGIPLRGSGTVDKRQGGFEAISLDAAPLPPSLFAVPSGYSRLDLSQLQGSKQP